MEYIETTFGWDKALAMLDAYKQGTGEHDTIQQVFGKDVESFMAGFMDWAGQQVQAWGMSTYAVKPEDAVLAALLSPAGVEAADLDTLMNASREHPDRPELLKHLTEKFLINDDKELATLIIEKFKQARPVDPWADRQLARLALDSGDAETAIAALTTLDKIEGNAPEYAVELSRVYRSRKAYDQALHYAERALLREPYNAIFREKAATVAIQHGDLSRAAFHVESLALLEPDRVIHPKRLAILYERLDQPEDAAAARDRVKKLELLEND
jgi:tetratricopeptide (TPR) repeat protein